ncbi:hypothetical protein FHW23_001767 [Curtobacterium pusillum]|uniref:FHA domain-containing protein n=1 Tax=Curtobacterium pusillum TaxID=69373 RepID=A0AAW3T5K5_9MICO|nr:hypothetical protein [Curtobacterium pusillum]
MAPEQPSTPQPAEPPLDPNAYPSTPGDGEDPEVTRLADRPASSSTPDPVEHTSAAPVWNPPAEQAPPPAPAGPSWWVGRSNASSTAANSNAAANTSADTDSTASDPEARASNAEAADVASSGAPAVSPPQPGDTAVVEPLVDRRPPRPAPLVTPGSQATTCHVCGHRLEPDDIFCAECGAVRPAVTAAFTGQIVPLPMDRPDWAADDTAADDAPADDAPADGARAHESEGPNGEPAVSDESGTATDGDGPGVGASATDEGSNPNRNPLPSWVNEGGEEAVDDDTPRAPLRARGAHAATETETETERESGGTPFVPPVPGSATLPSSAPSAPSAQDTAAIGVPFAAPLPPLPGATGPALPLPTADGGPTSADSDLDDDVDETRIVSKTPTRAPFVLHFSTGERFGVHGTGLVGRLPRPQPGERFDDLVTVHDPGKSVSKTHLELGRDGDDLWVSDRFSGNGTVVRHIDGSIRRCEPGRRYRVERGARVDIGEQFFLVQ